MYYLNENYRSLSWAEREMVLYEWGVENLGATVAEFKRWFAEDALYPYRFIDFEEANDDDIVVAIQFNGQFCYYDFEAPEELTNEEVLFSEWNKDIPKGKAWLDADNYDY